MIFSTLRWEGVCNVKFRYGGISDKRYAISDLGDGISVLSWHTFTSDLAPFSAAAGWVQSGNIIVEADVFLNTQAPLPPYEMGGLLTHEVGHMLGINHSDQPFSVMSAAPYQSFKFQRTLRGDDVKACQSLYGPSQNQKVERIFNWAEASYPWFQLEGQISQKNNEYTFRHYPTTGSYMGEKDGSLYVLGNEFILFPEITKIGTVNEYFPKAEAFGF